MDDHPVEWAKILGKAASYDCDRSDRYKIALAFKELYPDVLAECRRAPGYTKREMMDFIIDKITEWARTNHKEVFVFIKRERYLNTGFSEEEAALMIAAEYNCYNRSKK
jgi:hypothetical protein